TSKVKLGGDASAAAGPVGRNASAETDVTLRAEILSYSRARGLFAGVSLEGSTLRPDNDANKNLYGKEVSAKDIVFNGAVGAPPSAHLLLTTLNKKSPRINRRTNEPSVSPLRAGRFFDGVELRPGDDRLAFASRRRGFLTPRKCYHQSAAENRTSCRSTC